MFLRSVRIKNYKCIEDTGVFRLDKVTCLVGKNESGKSAILEALYKLNPVVADEGDFDDVIEYPRRRWSLYREKRETDPDIVLETVWELDDSDQEILTEKFGNKALSTKEVTITKGYDNTLNWEISYNEGNILKYVLENSGLCKEEVDALKEISTIEELIAYLEGKSNRSERENLFLENLIKTFPKKTVFSGVKNILQNRLPKFVYFPNYERMRGRVALHDLVNRKNQNKLDLSDRIFLALLDLAGTSIDEINKIGTLEHLYAELEAVSNRITETIFHYWSQNRHLEVEFRLDQGRPGDPPPFNQGFIFQTRIRNSRHRVTVNFEERSTGFIWFFSFLVWFSQLQKYYGKNLLVLLDEPGLSLHGRAQQDLLRYFREQLAPYYQVIYTTHSPFMIDPEALLSVRIVEDVVTSSGEVLGTKVREDVFATESETVFPLQAALGYDITQTLFVGKNVLLVEGPSDFLYLKWFSSELQHQNREGLDRRWVITPSGGIDKIASFVALFGGNEINIAVITDFHSGLKGKIKSLTELYRLIGVFTVNSYLGQAEADIEDLLGREFYFALVNRCYNLSDEYTLNPKKEPKNLRVVKEVEEHFRTLPPDFPEFDHYTPAAYLVENGKDLRNELPGLNCALDRFEQLFKDLNKLLR
jgi:predicted ATP-dependent endonuclease of OLD family